MDAGLPVRRRDPAVRRHRRARVSRTRPSAHGRAHGAASDAHRRARSRLQQRQHLRSALAPGARRPHRAPTTGRATSTSWRSRSAARCRRAAGRAFPAAASSIRSTARTRCSSTRSDRCARWRSAHRLGHRLLRGAGRQVNLLERLMQHARATARLQRLLRTRPRSLRRARPRRARKPVQRRQRNLSRPEHAAGLLSVHDLDARAGVGHARLRRAARVPRNAARRRARDAAAAGRGRRWMLEAARATCDYYIDVAARRRRPVLGCRRAGTARRSATGASAPADPFNDREPVDSSAAAIAAQGLLRLGRFLNERGERWRAILAGRPARRSKRCSIRRAVSEHGTLASGTDAAFRLSLAERLGPRAAGARIPRGESSQWGDYHAREVALYVARLAEVSRT